MEVGLFIAIGFAAAFALTNGFHDASNAIATLVATRGATPGQAVALSAVFNMAGAVLLGTAVADTIGKIVTVPQSQMVSVVGAGLAGATGWNLLTWWLGLPSSSGHALVGGLAGAAIADGVLSGYGGAAVGAMGRLRGLAPDRGDRRPRRAADLAGPRVRLRVPAAAAAAAGCRGAGRPGGSDPVRGGGWVAAAGLSFSHGGNDAQKAMGVIAVLLLASGHTDTLTRPAVGEGRHRRRADHGHRAGRLAHRQDHRPAHLQPHPARLLLQPGLVDRRHPRRLADRRAGEHHPGGGLLGRRRRRRADAGGSTCAGRSCGRWASPG